MIGAPDPLALDGAVLVLPDRLAAGRVVLDGELIGAIEAVPIDAVSWADSAAVVGAAATGAAATRMAATGSPGRDGCDYLIPGLIELHTDNLEHHLMPRPKVSFPTVPALLAHDAQIAAAGITTVCDALGVGDPYGDGFRARDQSALLAALAALHEAQLLRADHHLHVRCELPAPNARELFEPFVDHPRLRLISLMDHTPGQRQWLDLAHAETYYTGKKGWTREQFADEVARAPERQRRYAEPHRRHFADYARSTGIRLATHDDTTSAHVAEARALGATISEFPTTLEAARHARAAGLATVAGAPNVVRGGSHSGNVSAAALARAGLLDVLSSDYVPASLIAAAWLLHRNDGLPLPAAVATVTANAADVLGFADRGRLVPGLRADLVRVRVIDGRPVVLAVWVAGRRVH
ncbi:MAG: alpha-D-ribose 1-methylphosphonate 5-triphosphate diphosphatase [Lautropia sp.]